MVALVHRQVQHGTEDDEGRDAQRHIDVEHPAPAQVLGEQPAEQRPDDTGNAEHRAEQPGVLAAFARRHEVGDHRHDQDHQSPTADALQCTGGDELAHVLAQSGECGGHHEDRHG